MVEWFVLAFPTWIDWWEWTLKFDQIMTCSLLSSPGLDSKGSNILLIVSRLLINEYLNGKSTISSSFSEFIMNLLYAKDSNNCDDGCGSCFNPKGRWKSYLFITFRWKRRKSLLWSFRLWQYGRRGGWYDQWPHEDCEGGESGLMLLRSSR